MTRLEVLLTTAMRYRGQRCSGFVRRKGRVIWIQVLDVGTVAEMDKRARATVLASHNLTKTELNRACALAKQFGWE